MRRTGSLLYFAGILFFAGAVAVRVDAHDLPSGNLAALGRIWGIVEYAHPWLGYRDVDWDAAAVRAIDHVRASPNDLTGALTEMLATLGDDASFVRHPCVESAVQVVDRSNRILANGIVYVAATTPVDTNTIAMLRSARTAIVDLRPQPGRCAAPSLSADLVPLLVRGNVARARLRKVKHHGYRSQDPANTYEQYQSSFVTIATGFEIGANDTQVAKVVFIVNERSVIPTFATALAAAETATFVTAGKFPLASALDHCEMGLPDGMLVTLRTSELVDDDGYIAEPSAMITLDATASESEVLAAALQIAKPRSARRRASGPSAQRLPDYRWRADATYAEMNLPPPAYRILAAYRIWNVIHFFYGYPELIGDWHMQLGEFIVTLDHATTRQAYELALAEIMTLVPDGHTLVSSKAFLALRGAASPPFRLMPVEDKPVVVEVFPGTATVKTGDELLRIDGRDVVERMAELARYTSASTELTKKYYVARDLPNGAMDSQSVFTFRRPDGTQYDVTLTRGTQSIPDPKAWRILDGNIAYVDLRYLDVEEVPALFAEIANTRAMIVDIRNDPRNAFADMGMAMIRIPELIGGAFDSDERMHIGTRPFPPYPGRAIALIDERTQSDGEQTALAFDALADAEFVGSPTGGAIGNVTSFVVPGNILVRFTGMDVRFADGRQLQRVGVQPHYRVERTIRGLAEGRDEVLEKALQILN